MLRVLGWHETKMQLFIQEPPKTNPVSPPGRPFGQTHAPRKFQEACAATRPSSRPTWMPDADERDREGSPWREEIPARATTHWTPGGQNSA